MTRVPWKPNWTLAPAETLREWMETNGLSAPVLAVACAGRRNRDYALALVGDVLARKPLTAEHAATLEAGTGIPARFWLALEHNYRAGLAAGLEDASSDD